MRGMAEDTQPDSRDRGGARLRGRWVSCRLAVRPGMEWLSRAKARLNWVSQGQRRGRCKVRRRAERIRPTHPPPEGLGGHDLLTQADAGCPAGQVMRHHWTASQAPLAAKRPDGMWFNAVLEVGGPTSAGVIGLFQRLPIAVGDEA